MQTPDRDRQPRAKPKGKMPRPPMLTLTKGDSITFRPPNKPNRVEEETSTGLMWSVTARRGRRRTHREDMYAVLPFVDETPAHDPISLFGLFDGHGGQRVAQFASRRLPQLFLEAFEQTGDVRSALDYAFLNADREIIAASLENEPKAAADDQQENSGVSTGSALGCVALQAGISRKSSAIFSRAKSLRRKETKSRAETDGTAKKSADAAPVVRQAARTLKRLPSAGGAFVRAKSRAAESLCNTPVKANRSCGTTATLAAFVGGEMHIAHVGDSRAVISSEEEGARRLFEDHRPSRRDELERIEAAGGLVIEVSGTWRVNGVLAVSRAIGDVQYKEFVIARPEVQSVVLRGADEFVILGSDGLWDYVSDAESVEVVRGELGGGGGEEGAAKALVQAAWERGSTDDVSVVIVNLRKYREACDRFEGALEGGAVVEEVVEEVDVEKLRRRPADGGVAGEVVTPVAMALPLETSGVLGSAHW